MDTLRRLFLRPRTRVTLRQSHYYRGSAEDDAEFGGDDDHDDFCAMEEAPQEWGPPKDANVPEVPAFGLLEAPRRAQKIEISYARTAKKVDIQSPLSIYIYVYMCVCVCVCIYIYMYTCTYTHTGGHQSPQG